MPVRRLAEDQPKSFAFTPENAEWCEKIIAKYPEGREASAVLSLLWQAQKQNQYWLPQRAIEKVANMLNMPYIRVLEIATFYTMFNLHPVGRFFIQMCGTTPCVLAGSDSIKEVLEGRVGAQNQVTQDGNFSWAEVECLGACCNAPIVQINDDYYEDLTPENFNKLLDDLAAGRPVRAGSQSGRICSAPLGPLTSLTELYGADGRSGPQTYHGPASEGDSAAAQRELAHQNAISTETGAERLAAEITHAKAYPEKHESRPDERTNVPISETGKAHEAAVQGDAAKAGGDHQGKPAVPPGHEPASSPDAPR